MLLILEIILTVAAWRRGWRGWALLPVATSFTVGLLIGLVAASQGTPLDAGDLLPAAVIFDGGGIIALIVMIARKRERTPTVRKERVTPAVGIVTAEPTAEQLAKGAERVRATAE